MNEYDFSDSLIVSMVMDTHRPEERSVNGNLQPITCSKDGELWPCHAHQALKAWDAEQVAAAQARHPLQPQPLHQQPGGERPTGFMARG